MRSPLQRLYQTKLTLLAVLATVVGAGLMAACFWADPATRSKWFINSVLGLGGTLLGIGLLAIFFQYVGNEDAERRDDERTDRLLTKHAPAFRDAVIQGFAFNADDLARVANPATLDQIARNVLALQLGDRELADDVYTDLRNQVIQASERWHNVAVSVTLTPWSKGPAAGRDSMFLATLRWEYRVIPASTTMRFACVSDPDEYRDLLRDQAVTSAWYFDPSARVDAASPDAFELLQLSVDGKPCTIRRTQRKGAQLYAVDFGSAVMTGKPVVVTYTYRVLVPRHGHLLYLDLSRPAKGLKAQMNYGDAGIRRMTALDFIASSEPTRVDQAPSSVTARTIDIGFDGWVFPRSGVAFVWVLEDEIPAVRKKTD